MESNKANNLIVLNGGIGDVLLWIPTLKAFSENPPDVLFLYNTPVVQLLKDNHLVNEVFTAKNKFDLFLFALKKRKYYETIFLNHLCGGNFHLRMMNYSCELIKTNSPHYSSQNVIYYNALQNVHDSIQNYNLCFNKVIQPVVSDFNLNAFVQNEFNLSHSYITIQLSAAHNQTPYKNWPIKSWKKFIESFILDYPNTKVVLLGHKDEMSLVDQLDISSSQIISLVGKTTISQAFTVIQKSELFIGPDGGLMHIAVASGISTFTLWGGSSPVLYGYEKIDQKLHKVIQMKLPCMPCNAWISPNQTKTNDPLKCPDFACLTMLTPDSVMNDFRGFINQSSLILK